MNLIAPIILAPLAAAAVILLLRRASTVFALAGVVASLLSSAGLLMAVMHGSSYQVIMPGLPGMPLLLLAGRLTAVLAVVVAGIGALVFVYAIGYMKEDAEKVRFFALLSFFVAAMQTLVLAGDWLLFLSAWELIGFSSYLLIGFWFQRPGVGASASRAFLYTRTADLGLYVAVFLLVAQHADTAIATTLAGNNPTTVLAGLLLLIAAMGKSAQTPLHDWLQRAMVGPTPVSALLHSATLVAAGAILMIRVVPVLPPEARLAVGLVGGVTTVVTGLIALAEADLKRMLAASTSSQYGLMLVAVGAGVPLAALLHLIAHAAIKSSLFLGAGVFQHSREDTAFTNLRGVGRDHAWVFSGFVVAALALAGIPPLSGFFSKDAVIGAALAAEHAYLLAPLALAGTLLTGAYMARALRILWRGDTHAGHVVGLRWMGAGIAGVVLLAAVLGATFGALEEWLGAALPTTILAQVSGLSAALIGLALGWLVPAPRLFGPLYRWAQQGFTIAGGIDALIVRPVLFIARLCARFELSLYTGVLAIGRLGMTIARAARCGDEQGIDRAIFALAHGSRRLGARVAALQDGLVHHELALAVIGTALMLAALLAGVLYF